MALYDSFSIDPHTQVQLIAQTGSDLILNQTQLKSGSFFAFLNASDTSYPVSFFMSFVASSMFLFTAFIANTNSHFQLLI